MILVHKSLQQSLRVFATATFSFTNDGKLTFFDLEYQKWDTPGKRGYPNHAPHPQKSAYRLDLFGLLVRGKTLENP